MKILRIRSASSLFLFFILCSLLFAILNTRIAKTQPPYYTATMRADGTVDLYTAPIQLVESAPIPKPSVPEFTLKIVDSSYDVPTTYTIDPFTGENVTHAGYHVESRTIEVTIKNQPFVPYYDNSSGMNIKFYYNIRIKGHYSEDWIELYRASDGYPIPSDSQYTIFSYVLGENADTILGTKMIKFPPGAQVDFQVEAMIGFVYRTIAGSMAPWVFGGQKSGWSETKTLTIDITPPTIYVVSPKNKTYTVNHVSLTFNVSESTSWVGYSLDGQAKVTVTGNITLSDLSSGEHSLTVYAKDTAGNTGTSETIYFGIKTFPITWIVVAIAIVAIVGASLLVYFRKIRKTTGKTEIISEGVM